MHRWLHITNVETGSCATIGRSEDCYMVIFFRQSYGFTAAFKQAKIDAK